MPRLFLLGLCLLTGCASLPFFSLMNYPVADDRHPVMEVLCVWEAAEGRGLDNQPARGFGGQILFFASGHKEPAKVHGDVRIYVFDEEGVNGDPSTPIHQFDFPAAVWDSFLRPSNLGATYQIFIPYTRKGMNEAKCTLRVRFTPEGGLPIYSRMATIPLAGIENHKEVPARHEIQAAAAEEESTGSQIKTADWSELISGTTLPENGNPAQPGIPVNPSVNHQQALNRLRQAAASASAGVRSEGSDVPQDQ